MATHLYFIIKKENVYVRNVAIALMQGIWPYHVAYTYVVSAGDRKKILSRAM